VTSHTLYSSFDILASSSKNWRSSNPQTFLQSFYWHSTVSMALSCIISKMKQTIGRKWHFFTPQLHSLPTDCRIEGDPVGFCHNASYGRTRTVGLLKGEKSLKIRLAISTQYTAWQTDKWTDKWTCTSCQQNIARQKRRKEISSLLYGA